MTLLRPELRPEDDDEQTLNTTVVLGELRQIKDGQNYLQVILLGGRYRDVQHEGKLPQLEVSIGYEREARKHLATRVQQLEDDKKLAAVARRSAVRTAAAIGSIISTMFTAAGALLIDYLKRH